MEARLGRGLALTAAVTAMLVAVPHSGASPAAQVVATYRITVTGSVATEKIGSGEADNFRGTASWTHTYPRVRFTIVPQNGQVGLRPNRALEGTGVAHWDHQGDSCGPLGGQTIRESGTTRGRSILQFGAGVPVFGRAPFRWAFNLESWHGAVGGGAMNSGDIPTCATRHQGILVLTGRKPPPRSSARYSYSSAAYYETGVNLSFEGSKGKGEAGFPLDRLLAGKGFSYQSRGTNRNSQTTRDDLKNGRYAYVTDGSIKIVFTPVR